MPRTKVSKSSKRNREEKEKEKIREFEGCASNYADIIDSMLQTFIEDFNTGMGMLINRTKAELLQMRMGDILLMDMNALTANVSHSSLTDSNISTLSHSVKVAKSNDEGYFTTDSSGGGSLGSNIEHAALLNASHMRTFRESGRLRTPGPLSSARARKPRRSRSACNDYISTGTSNKLKPGDATKTLDRQSRSKMRTPMINRSKAHSSDRPCYMDSTTNSPPAALMRWAKPGELVMSKCGSPIVAQVLPDKFANVYIPVRNGVLSLRPKKIVEFQRDILEEIDPETLDQLKTLNANIDKIVNMANSLTTNKYAKQ